MSYISELKTRIEVDNLKGFSDIYADILLKISGGTLWKSNMFKSFMPYIFCRFLSMRPDLREYANMFNLLQTTLTPKQMYLMAYKYIPKQKNPFTPYIKKKKEEVKQEDIENLESEKSYQRININKTNLSIFEL